MSLVTFTKVGRFTKEIELRYLPSGSALAKTSIVFSEKYQDKEDTCFIDVVAFGKTAETLNNHFQKGNRIEGQFKLKQENWTSQDGQNRSKHILVLERISEFIESKQQSQMNYQQPQQSQQQYQAPQHIPEVDIDSSEIPF